MEKRILEKSAENVSGVINKLTIMSLSTEPAAASGFCAGGKNEIVNAGVNGIFPTVHCPQIVQLASQGPVPHDALSYASTVVNKGLLFNISCVKVAETSKHANERSVDSKLSSVFSQFFKTESTSETQIDKFILKNVNASFGLATAESKPDFLHTTLNGQKDVFGLCIFEFKDTAFAPLEQMGQAFVAGCNIILSHLGLGLKPSECAVPLVLTNGNLYQFAWVTILEPSFPVLHVTTGVLDASVQETRQQIAHQLVCIKLFCFRVAQKIGESTTFQELTKIQLDLERFHLKLFKDTFLRWSENPQESLSYLWRIYEGLVDVEEAVLPHAFANIKLDGTEESKIIFPRLEPDFAMGIPSDESLYKLFLVKLEASIKKIHAKGIIHVDLYPSNILWRSVGDDIIIRIVDWDAATLDGDSFTNDMLLRLENDTNAQYYWKSDGVAEPKCDYWFLFILTNLTVQERNAMNGSTPGKVNQEYKASVTRQSRSDPKLKQSFVEWYDEQHSERLNENN
jgi:hypothetical protein